MTETDCPAAGSALAEATTQASPAKSVLRDYAETILVCVIFVIFTRAFVFQQSKIPSGSMMDTLLVGDYIMVNRFVFSPAGGLAARLLPVRPIRRGDVVVFRKPDEPETDYIKRVVGLPGELLELRQGRLFVDGQRVEEPYLEAAYRDADPERNFGPARVAPGHYFVMGDHRNASSDSRVWGLVPADSMKGRALLVWWSYEEPPEAKIYMTLGERLRSWGDKLIHFPNRTRWKRCFRLIS